MDIKKIKKDIRREISAHVIREGQITRDFIKDITYRIFASLPKDHDYYKLGDAAKKKIVEAICDDFMGLGPLQQLMDDPGITEIMVNGPYKVYIEKSGKKVLSGVEFDDESHLRYIVEKMLAPTGRRVDESYPYVDFSLEDGSRINVIIPPLAVGGAVEIGRASCRERV